MMNTKRTIKIGSRESKLAVIQANMVINAIKENNPLMTVQLITIKTTGDKILDKTLDKIGGKGLFIKELEQSLLSGDIDIAVHSYKDMPFEENNDLPIVALSKREDPRDALVLPLGVHELNLEKAVGSSSLRRAYQLKTLYQNLEVKPIRGNVLTRLDKLDSGEFSGIVLAMAGLKRLGLESRVSKIFSTKDIIPSASQGILAIQGRMGEDYSYLSFYNDRDSETVSHGEREFLRVLNGGCSTPIAVYGELHNNEIKLTGMYVNDIDNVIRKASLTGRIDEAKTIGERLALMLKEGKYES